MNDGEFIVEIDGCRVLVDQVRQRVTILGEEGGVLFHDRIQVAAGSLQGIFSMLDVRHGLAMALTRLRWPDAERSSIMKEH